MSTHATFPAGVEPAKHAGRSHTNEVARLLVPLGRLLFALIFLASAPGLFAPKMIGMTASQGVPLASVLVPVAGALALFGGLSVLLGYRARVGAWLLIAFLVPVTFFMHDFWNVTDPGMHLVQQIMFMKNLALLGGALLIAYFGAGPVSIDERRAEREEHRAT
jgi:putative oxidoreductase